MKLLLSFSALIGVVSSSCYSPKNSTAKYQVMSASTVESQWNCDTQCTSDQECVAYEVKRKADHVVCIFLGSLVDGFICSAPVEVYEKRECENPLQFAGSIGANGKYGAPIESGTSLVTNGYKVTYVKPDTAFISIVYEGCETHFHLLNKSTVTFKFTGRSNPEPDRPYTDYGYQPFVNFVDAWGYCK